MIFKFPREKKTPFFNIARILGTLALQRYGGRGVSFIDGVRKLDSHRKKI